MKAYHPILLFLLLIGSSIMASVVGYQRAEQKVVNDMNQALLRTLAEKQSLVLTPDTIATYRDHLQLACLKKNSIVCYDMDEQSNGLRSKAISWKAGQQSQAFRSYANCSMATVLSLSEQRPAAILALLALASLAFTLRRKQESTPLAVALGGSHQCGSQASAVCVGGLTWHAEEHRFYNQEHAELHLTPMQKQLMEMFFQTADNRLAKQDICNRLWPKKPDASATLYTLIRRIKPILEQNSSLTIETERGGDYLLKC